MEADVLVRTPAELGQVLRHARTEANISQSELADWLNVSRFYVGSLESGKATERLERLITALSLLGFELHAAPRGEIYSRPLAVEPAAEPDDES